MFKLIKPSYAHAIQNTLRKPAAGTALRLQTNSLSHCFRPFSIESGTGGSMDEKIAVDLSNERKPYEKQTLLETDLESTDPFQLFHAWFQKIKEDKSLIYEEVNAVALTTVSAENRPTCRMVLLKSYDRDGFRFFTNYNSRKGRDLAQNPYASILFYWPKAHRQVHVAGRVCQLPADEADAYWAKRPLQSRASAAASQQSQVVPSRQYLVDRVDAIMKQAETEPETAGARPPHWGGYLLVPDEFEFWQGQSDRLHDRFRFRQQPDGDRTDWVMERLAP